MMITIRTMRREDIPAGTELCQLAGWNQLEADWQRLLDLEPEGVFVAEKNGTVCGSASALCYGTRLAWIGMVLVHPDFRGCGIGNNLMKHCIAFLQNRQIESIKLDATDMGRPVYLKLGFQDEEPIIRCSRPATTLKTTPVGLVGTLDWEQIARLDPAAFGADRSALLKHLSGSGHALQYCENGEFGIGFSRPGFHVDFIGPVMATGTEAAEAVLRELVARHTDRPLMLDLLPANRMSQKLVESLGFTASRTLTRMTLGAPCAGNPDRIFAAAGFELG